MLTTQLLGSSVFLAGILSFFSPCILPLLPVYMGKLLDTQDTQGTRKSYLSSILKTLAFILGLSTIFFLLGFAANFLGQILYSTYTNYILGGIVILMGLHQMEVISIRSFYQNKTLTLKNQSNGFLSAFLLGVTFSLGWTPCIGPVLGALLAVAATGQGSVFYGSTLMLVYALGLAVPFFILAFASTWAMKSFNHLKKYMLTLKKVGGALIVLMGLALMLGQLNYLLQFLS